VLIANLVWMRDERGGWKALDTAFVRDQLHAATAIGRMAAARVAVELGYAITPDDGPSGRLGSWAVAGIPEDALAVHAKRSAQIDARVGPDASFRDRNTAARLSRDRKSREPVADLLHRWRSELAEAGFPPERIWAGVVAAARRRPPPAESLPDEAIALLLTGLLEGTASRLNTAKVFDRADVIVAAAPHLHGLPLAELDRVVNAVIADVRCVPLIGVAGARTHAYATAATLAAEERIAELAETLATSPAARIDADAAQGAVERVEAQLAARMTPGQRRAARGLLSSGAGLELVVGVAGSGKTTMLAAVAAGFAASGFTVIGTATSGQAARGLGEGAGLGESRTIASLCWRLDNDRVRLGPRHVLICDEAGMTDDPDLGRLLAAVHAAGAKLIAVGDDRQLSPVGPGGGLAALTARHPGRVWKLTANVRQHDPGERRALAELRAGKPDAAVDWYAEAGRVVAAPSRDDAIAAMVDAWTADLTGDLDPLLRAWKRADVDDLNRKARAAYATLGRLAGPEVEARGGRAYRAGDWVLMLTPGPAGAWVTSEHATVTAVYLHDGSLDAVTPDGRHLHLDADATRAERLTYAYAITVHRSQGATSDSAHVLEDGGGRELAYVAMSRARHSSRVYVPAFNADQAVEHLRWAWADQRRQLWAHDQGQPQPPLRQLIAARDRLANHVALQAGAVGSAAHRQLVALDRDIADLHTGTGRWADTPAGTAARALRAAESQLRAAERGTGDHEVGFVQRRRAARAVPDLRVARSHAQQRWQPRQPAPRRRTRRPTRRPTRPGELANRQPVRLARRAPRHRGTARPAHHPDHRPARTGS